MPIKHCQAPRHEAWLMMPPGRRCQPIAASTPRGRWPTALRDEVVARVGAAHPSSRPKGQRRVCARRASCAFSRVRPFRGSKGHLHIDPRGRLPCEWSGIHFNGASTTSPACGAVPGGRRGMCPRRLNWKPTAMPSLGSSVTSCSPADCAFILRAMAVQGHRPRTATGTCSSCGPTDVRISATWSRRR